jgi:hypothetical protein
MTKQWELWECADGTCHVIPTGDRRKHVRNASCWCGPEEEDDGDLFVHHALDGRDPLNPATRYA